MSIFTVVIVEDVYERYTVEAVDKEEAIKKVRNPAIRLDLPSSPAGGGDNFDVVDVIEEIDS